MHGRIGIEDRLPDPAQRVVSAPGKGMQRGMAGGKEGAQPRVEGPAQFVLRAEKDRAQRKAAHPPGVGLGVDKPERRPPRAADDEPPLKPECLAHTFEIGHEMGGRVRVPDARRQAPPRAALVDKDDAVAVGVEEPLHRGRGAAARPAVEENDRNSRRIAPDPHPDAMPVADLEVGALSVHPSLPCRPRSCGR